MNNKKLFTIVALLFFVGLAIHFFEYIHSHEIKDLMYSVLDALAISAFLILAFTSKKGK